MLINVIIPILLYYVLVNKFGIMIALIGLAIWTLILILFYHSKGSVLGVALAIIFTGIFNFIWDHNPHLFSITNKQVFLDIISGISTAALFTFYSLKGTPLIRILAEQSVPRLKTSVLYNTAIYNRVWQEVSMCWIFLNILKIIVLLILYAANSNHLDEALLMCSWPLTLFLVLFSIRYPKVIFKKYKKYY